MVIDWSAMSGHTIVAGYGIPGRALVEFLVAHRVPHCVIEMNPATVSRCERGASPIIAGDCNDPAVLALAGIMGAATLAILIPDEKAALKATSEARRLNPTIRIITRCHYISAGIEAKAHGANEVIVAEQVVAAEVLRRAQALIDHNDDGASGAG